MQNSRLTLLRVLVKLMSLLALCAFVWVLFGSVPERPQGEPEVTRFNVSDMQPGDYVLVEWQKKPLYIVYRKPDWESALRSADAGLYRDPDSNHSVQPARVVNALRSTVPGWFVTLGLGTGAGCTLTFTDPDPDPDPDPDRQATTGDGMPGSFTDGCDQSRYDLAGRVYADQAARRNTVIPEWRLESGEILVSE